MKILIIANLKSGKGRAADLLPAIKQVLKPDNELKIYLTAEKQKTISFAAANADNFDFVVVVGGDGTLSEVINGFAVKGSKTPLGYIPAGSTNDFASSLGLEKDPIAASENFLKMRIKSIDIGCFNSACFTYVAAAGVFSKTSYATPQELKKRLGKFAYMLGGVTSIPTARPIHLRAEVDGKTFEDDYFLALVSNSYCIGGMLKYDKNLISLDDGKLEVMLVKEPENANELGSLLKDILYRNFDGGYIDFASGSNIVITSPKKIAWSLDGEFGGEHDRAEIKVCPKALNLLV